MSDWLTAKRFVSSSVQRSKSVRDRLPHRGVILHGDPRRDALVEKMHASPHDLSDDELAVLEVHGLLDHARWLQSQARRAAATPVSRDGVVEFRTDVAAAPFQKGAVELHDRVNGGVRFDEMIVTAEAAPSAPTAASNVSDRKHYAVVRGWVAPSFAAAVRTLELSLDAVAHDLGREVDRDERAALLAAARTAREIAIADAIGQLQRAGVLEA